MGLRRRSKPVVWLIPTETTRKNPEQTSGSSLSFKAGLLAPSRKSPKEPRRNQRIIAAIKSLLSGSSPQTKTPKSNQESVYGLGFFKLTEARPSSIALMDSLRFKPRHRALSSDPVDHPCLFCAIYCLPSTCQTRRSGQPDETRPCTAPGRCVLPPPSREPNLRAGRPHYLFAAYKDSSRQRMGKKARPRLSSRRRQLVNASCG